MTVPILSADDQLAVAATQAIRTGDIAALQQLLYNNRQLATAHIGDNSQARSLLHVVTDWPGHFPRAVDTVAALVQAGADVNSRFAGPHGETPLHWAASSDDIDVLDALLDAGAHIDADGAVIAGGTPLTDATAFGQWNAARRLVERGARSGLWESATLGLLEHVQNLLAADPAPTDEEITGSFWAPGPGAAAAGTGRRRTG